MVPGLTSLRMSLLLHFIDHCHHTSSPDSTGGELDSTLWLGLHVILQEDIYDRKWCCDHSCRHNLWHIFLTSPTSFPQRYTVIDMYSFNSYFHTVSISLSSTESFLYIKHSPQRAKQNIEEILQMCYRTGIPSMCLPKNLLRLSRCWWPELQRFILFPSLNLNL